MAPQAAPNSSSGVRNLEGLESLGRGLMQRHVGASVDNRQRMMAVIFRVCFLETILPHRRDAPYARRLSHWPPRAGSVVGKVEAMKGSDGAGVHLSKFS